MSTEPLTFAINPFDDFQRRRGPISAEDTAILARADAGGDAQELGVIHAQAHSRHGQFAALLAAIDAELARVGAPSKEGAAKHAHIMELRATVERHVAMVTTALADLGEHMITAKARVQACDAEIAKCARERCAKEWAAFESAQREHADAVGVAQARARDVATAQGALTRAEATFAQSETRAHFDAITPCREALAFEQARHENARAQCEPLHSAMMQARAEFDRAVRQYERPAPRAAGIEGDEAWVKTAQARFYERVDIRNRALAGKNADAAIDTAARDALYLLRRLPTPEALA